MDSYDYAFLLGLLCGADSMHTKMSHEIEEMRRQMEEEMRREAEIFNRFVQLKNRAHELANVLWAAIKTIHDEDTRKKVKSAVAVELDRLKASDQAHRQGRARPERS
jgi:hypothetical protein